MKKGDRHDFYERADLELCETAVDLPPDLDRATAEGTQRYVSSRKSLHGVTLGNTGLKISPVGFVTGVLRKP